MNRPAESVRVLTRCALMATSAWLPGGPDESLIQPTSDALRAGCAIDGGTNETTRTGTTSNARRRNRPPLLGGWGALDIVSLLLIGQWRRAGPFLVRAGLIAVRTVS